MTVGTVAQRLRRLRRDPWADYWTASQTISKAALRVIAQLKAILRRAFRWSPPDHKRFRQCVSHWYAKCRMPIWTQPMECP